MNGGTWSFVCLFVHALQRFEVDKIVEFSARIWCLIIALTRRQFHRGISNHVIYLNPSPSALFFSASKKVRRLRPSPLFRPAGRGRSNDACGQECSGMWCKIFSPSALA